MFTSHDLHSLARLIRELALHELLPRFNHTHAEIKTDGSLVTEADLVMQQQLQNILYRHWPGIMLLGEEMSEAEQQRIFHEAVNGLWIVDPLDGTSNFSNGIPNFSVSVALVQQGQLQCGVVYDPCRDECFTALNGQGAWLNNLPINLATHAHPAQLQIGIVDFKRLSADLAIRLATQPPYKSQRSFGSVALDWCWLAAGRGQVYLHGKQKIWDYAAGLLILTEAGGLACTLNGDPVFTGEMQSRSAVAAVTQTHFDTWRRYLGILPG